jgi:hypothetical protein
MLPTAEALFSGSIDKTIRWWNPQRGTLVATLRGHTGPVWYLQATQKSLYSGGDDRTVRQWDLRTGSLQATFPHSGPVRCLLVAHGALYSGADDATLLRCGLREPGATDARAREALRAHTGNITCLLDQDGELYSGAEDGMVVKWEAGSSTPVRAFEGHTNWITCLLCMRGVLFSGSRDATIKSWDTVTGTLLGNLQGHTRGVTCLLPIEEALMSGSADRTIRLWSPPRGELLAIVECRTGITCLLHAGASLYCGLARSYPMRFLPPRIPKIEQHSAFAQPLAQVWPGREIKQEVTLEELPCTTRRKEDGEEELGADACRRRDVPGMREMELEWTGGSEDDQWPATAPSEPHLPTAPPCLSHV